MTDHIQEAKRKLRDIMKQRRITRNVLAEYAGTTQPRVSVCLNLDNEKFFPAWQVCNICEKLNISMDELFGLSARPKHSVNDACASLLDLLENYYVQIGNVTITEAKHDLYFKRSLTGLHETSKSEYLCLYFPEYLDPYKDWRDPAIDWPIDGDQEWEDHVTRFGNDIPENNIINEFLKKAAFFIDGVLHGQISKETAKGLFRDALNSVGND